MRQEDLAEKTGLSANYIGMLERGEKLPALYTFISILNALGITADAVLCDVLENGYTVKNSLLNDKLQSLPEAERNKIYEVIDFYEYEDEEDEIALIRSEEGNEIEVPITELIEIQHCLV